MIGIRNWGLARRCSTWPVLSHACIPAGRRRSVAEREAQRAGLPIMERYEKAHHTRVRSPQGPLWKMSICARVRTIDELYLLPLALTLRAISANHLCGRKRLPVSAREPREVAHRASARTRHTHAGLQASTVTAYGSTRGHRTTAGSVRRGQSKRRRGMRPGVLSSLVSERAEPCLSVSVLVILKSKSS